MIPWTVFEVQAESATILVRLPLLVPEDVLARRRSTGHGVPMVTLR